MSNMTHCMNSFSLLFLKGNGRFLDEVDSVMGATSSLTHATKPVVVPTLDFSTKSQRVTNQKGFSQIKSSRELQQTWIIHKPTDKSYRVEKRQLSAVQAVKLLTFG